MAALSSAAGVLAFIFASRSATTASMARVSSGVSSFLFASRASRVECTTDSAEFLTSMASRRALSWPAYFSASRIICWISDSESPPEVCTTVSAFAPVAWSTVVTRISPSALMSNVTSICGTPRRMGGMPSRRRVPRSLLSAAISRSPWRICATMYVCESTAVVKVFVFLVGIGVLRSMMRAKSPPSTFVPSESGVTSMSAMPRMAPSRIPP
eukprot:Amastigsp_a510354_29.p2 type:complete len:212 gc:universal Amastigsp_a510354_29:1089-454(-)